MGRGTYLGGGTIEGTNSINSQSLTSKNLSFYSYYNYNYDQDKYKNISKELLLYILSVNYDILVLINKLKFTSNFKVIYQSNNHRAKIKKQFKLLKKLIRDNIPFILPEKDAKFQRKASSIKGVCKKRKECYYFFNLLKYLESVDRAIHRIAMRKNIDL